ncbi:MULTISPECIES: YecA family protein [unclassified Serratia (in: enterobacteria)]|uniref:YecA family protein n=1 Tax=unclassified Serratia (in: enterobacteria) TaxID=2647522 RepID=UPI003B42EBB0
MSKISRNAECWCGSRKKYKRCHYNRDKQTPFSRGDAQSLLTLFSNVSRCSVPDRIKHECQTRIVKAHTLSKGNSLNAIAHAGHVLGIKHGLSSLERNNGRITLEKIGVNQASTFTGFCSYHDKELFSCVEDEPFKVTKKQCTMLAYRPLMREVYVKEANYKAMELTREFDRGMSFPEQLAWAKMANININGAKLSLSDLNHIRNRVEKSIEDYSFDVLNHFILYLEQVPNIMACGIHAPIADIFCNELQQITPSEDKRPAYMAVNILALDKNGYMIFSWLPEDSEIINKFISAIKMCSFDLLGDKLTNYTFTFFENVFVSEPWWESLGETKEHINKLIMQGVIMHVYDLSMIENDNHQYNAINVNHFVELN